MKLLLKSKVKGHYKKVMQAFDRNLFEALKPPIGRMEILEFTGSEKGDRVHVQFLSPVKTEWISDIIEHGSNDKRAWFVDRGIKLPWPLETWEHRHIVERVDEDHSMIIDDITFTGSNLFLSLLLYPAIFLGFYPRKKIYQQYFKNL